MSEDMPDSTRELLNANHKAVLRELDVINRGVSDIVKRTGTLESRVNILSWAYGLGAALLAGIAAKFGLGGGR